MSTMIEKVNLLKLESSLTSLAVPEEEEGGGESSSTATRSPRETQNQNGQTNNDRLEEASSPSSAPLSPFEHLTLVDLTIPNILDSPNNKTIAVDVPVQRKSQFWSLQEDEGAVTKSSIAPSVRKRLQLNRDSKDNNLILSAIPALPERNSIFPNRRSATIPAATAAPSATSTFSRPSITTRQTLDGSGPKVRLTRAALLKLQSRQPVQKSQKPNSSSNSNTNYTQRQKSIRRTYARPWRLQQKEQPESNVVATSPHNSPPRIKKLPITHRSPQQRAKRRSWQTKLAPQPPSSKKATTTPPSSPPTIHKLPARKSPRIQSEKRTYHSGKVRLTRAAMLKLKQSQFQAQKSTTTQKDWDNQRLGIPPIKILEVPRSPTKLNFTDEEMEHPNDIARNKFQQQFLTKKNMIY